MKNQHQFHRFAQGLLLYTLLVILWGAWVRISHSGDGCGDSWPLCQGQILPEAQHKKTWVEFSHRLTSGLFGLLVIYFFWAGRKLFPAGDRARKALGATLIFMITEALLGAKLVLFGLVAGNDSPFRVFAMSLHQVNSLLLSGSVAMAALFSSSAYVKLRQENSREKSLGKNSYWFLILFITIAVTGAIASLSTTLFPTTHLLEGFSKDFAAESHYLLKLRISHPIWATVVGGALALFFWFKSQNETQKLLKNLYLQVALILVVGVVFGYLTLFSLSPVWMKLGHLLLAHLMWVMLLRWYWVRK